jgi:hypothetical protein
MMRRVCSIAFFAAVAAIALDAQSPSFSGTWKLDAARSRITPDAGFAALIAAGAPERLHVTQPANGTLIVESEINEGQARIYTPRGKTTTAVFFQGGTVTVTSKWDGRRLVAEGTQETPAGASVVVKQIKEVIALADANTLSIEITSTVPEAESRTTTLTYVRTQDVGPCETWTTPCKRK